MAGAAISIAGDLLGLGGSVMGLFGQSPKQQLETSQTKVTENAQFAGAEALYYAYAGNATAANSSLQVMLTYLQQYPGGGISVDTLPGGKGLWGVYFQTSEAGFDVPNPFAGVSLNQAAFNAAHKAVSGVPLTFRQVAQMVQSVAAGGNAAALTAPGTAAAVQSTGGQTLAGGTVLPRGGNRIVVDQTLGNSLFATAGVPIWLWIALAVVALLALRWVLQ
jgi:hypothetical protein